MGLEVVGWAVDWAAGGDCRGQGALEEHQRFNMANPVLHAWHTSTWLLVRVEGDRTVTTRVEEGSVWPTGRWWCLTITIYSPHMQPETAWYPHASAPLTHEGVPH